MPCMSYNTHSSQQQKAVCYSSPRFAAVATTLADSSPENVMATAAAAAAAAAATRIPGAAGVGSRGNSRGGWPMGRWPAAAAVRLIGHGAVGLLLAAAVVSQAYDITRLKFSAPYYSQLPVLVLGSNSQLPNEPKLSAGLLISGCSSDGGGGGGSNNGTVEGHGADGADSGGGSGGGGGGGGWGSCCLGCDKSPQLVTAVGAELRGRSSQAASKKSYAVELQSPDGSSAPTSLLGLPAAAGWILYGPSLDRSLIRDALSYELARAQGRWASHCRFVELFVVEDGATYLDQKRHYKGLYALTEPIERGRNRVDVHKLEKDEDLSGGFILELSNAAAADWWATQLGEKLPSSITKIGPTRVDFKYPEDSKAPPPAWYYVSSLMSNLSSALYSASSYSSAGDLSYIVDVPSLVDFMLHTELSCDYDGFVSSVFFYKDRGSPLMAGPVWDKNLAYGNEVEVTSPTGCGWRYAAPAVQNSGQMAIWMGALARAGWWRREVATRWRKLRGEDGDPGPWSDSALRDLVDRLEGLIPAESARRNSDRWPLGSISPNQRFVALPPTKGSWAAEVDALRSWLLARASWMDKKLLKSGAGNDSGGGDPELTTPPQPNLITGVLGAVLGGRPVVRAFQEGSRLGR